jgi:hypothetical protein
VHTIGEEEAIKVSRGWKESREDLENIVAEENKWFFLKVVGGQK